MPGFLDLSLLKSRPTGGTLPRCGLCGLLKKCRSPKMPVAGKGEKRILVVGEAPGAEEDDKGIPFVGKTGTYLRDTLAEMGIDLRRDCWLTNSLVCFVSPKVSIYTTEGYKWIKDIQVGDLVLTHKGRFRRVLSRSMDLPEHLRTNKGNLVDIKVGTTKLTVTADHLFLRGEEWVRADAIKKGDQIKVLGEKCVICGKIYHKNPTRYDTAENTCSQTCHNRSVAKKSGPAISKAMKKQYADGTRDPVLITEEAHKKVRELAEQGLWNPSIFHTEEGKRRGYEKSAKLRQAKNRLSDAKDLIGAGEKEVCDVLIGKGMDFYSQYAVGTENLDFYIPSLSLILEVENVKKFGFTRKYKKEYYEHREELAESIGAKVIFIRSTDPAAEVERLLKNDLHEYHYLDAPVTKVVVRDGTGMKNKNGTLKPYRLYCLEVEEDHSYVSTGIVSHNCRPPKNTITDERMIDWCRPLLLKTIEELQPETIVLLGARALKSLIAWLWKEDAGGINKWAGFRIPCQRLNAWVCPTWHPSFVVRENETRRDGGVTELVWKRHLKAAFRTGRPWSEVPSYASCIRTELNPERAAAAVRRLIASGRVLAFDYENTTLKPDGKHARIYCCAISDGEESIAYPWHGEAITASIEFLRSSVPKIGFNVKHEQRYSRANLGVKVQNFVWDGMLAAHVLDNRSDTKSLKFQAFVLLGQESYDDAIKPYLKSKGSNDRNRITELDLEAVLRYCGMDAILEWHVAMKQAKKLGVSLC